MNTASKGIGIACTRARLRSKVIPTTSNRSFHASPQRRFIAECIDQTQTLIVSLHGASGLSWAATLPLTAMLIRLGLLGPLATYAHVKANQRRELQPLMYAWQHAIRRNVFKKYSARGPAECHKMASKQLYAKGRQIRKEMGVQIWKSSLSWLQLPVFLVAIESIRKLCGTHGGLLALMMKRPAETASRDDILQDVGNASSYELKESLADEGALWFPDLTVADPMLIMPFMLSGCLFANILFHERRATATGIVPGKWQLRLQHTMKIIALAIGPATLGVPSAMLIYWITSSICALGQNVFLQWYMPGKPLVTPCKPRGPDSPSGSSVAS